MPIGAILFGLFVAIPLIEVALFVQVGGWLGLWPTIACVLATALIGSSVIRWQGLGLAQRARGRLDAGGLPVREAFDGLCLVVAGLLMITPGFFTDAIGGLLLIPPVRAALYAAAAKRIEVQGAGPFPPDQPDVIDVEFEEVEPDNGKSDPGRGWGPKR